MQENRFKELLDQILTTHSPSGDEGEIDALLLPLFEAAADEAYQDPFGNIVGIIKGKSAGDPLKILAHKDEIGFVVKKIEDSGKIKVDRVGATYPWKYGEVPVDILGKAGITKGVLSMGSLHTSLGGHPVRDFVEKRTVNLNDVYVTTLLGKEALRERGIHPGTRIVVAREFKRPIYFEGAVSGYHLDNKVAVVLMLLCMEHFRATGIKPDREVYFVATCMEEVGAQGAVYCAHQVPGGTTVALEIGPVAEEYDITLNDQPVLWYGPSAAYHKQRSDAIVDLADELGFGAQPGYLWGAGSDASKIHQMGLSTAVVCLAFPCDNTHGYEVATVQGCLNTAQLLVEAIQRGVI